MLARVWKTGIQEDHMNEYLQFVHSYYIPMFRMQYGITLAY
jgi:hypothetical protein